jgi:hypothetical protein
MDIQVMRGLCYDHEDIETEDIVDFGDFGDILDMLDDCSSEGVGVD